MKMIPDELLAELLELNPTREGVARIAYAAGWEEAYGDRWPDSGILMALLKKAPEPPVPDASTEMWHQIVQHYEQWFIRKYRPWLEVRAAALARVKA